MPTRYYVMLVDVSDIRLKFFHGDGLPLKPGDISEGNMWMAIPSDVPDPWPVGVESKFFNVICLYAFELPKLTFDKSEPILARLTMRDFGEIPRCTRYPIVEEGEIVDGKLVPAVKVQ